MRLAAFDDQRSDVEIESPPLPEDSEPKALSPMNYESIKQQVRLAGRLADDGELDEANAIIQALRGSASANDIGMNLTSAQLKKIREHVDLAPKRRPKPKKGVGAKRKASSRLEGPVAPDVTRASESLVDPITGERSAGVAAVPSGRYYVRAGTGKASQMVDVEIAGSELGSPRTTYKVNLEPAELRRRAEAIIESRQQRKAVAKSLKRLKGKSDLPGIAGTFRSAGKAAANFLADNELYFMPYTEGVVDTDDAFRDWADKQEVFVSRKTKPGYYARLADTTKGEKILRKPGAKGGGATGRLLNVLTWIFSQTPSKRYADVDWHRIEALADSLREALDNTDGAVVQTSVDIVYPVASGRYDATQLLAHPDIQAKPRTLAYAQAQVNSERIHEALTDLENAFDANKECMSPMLRNAVQARLTYLRRLESDPTMIATASICAYLPQGDVSGDMIAQLEELGGDLSLLETQLACNFPTIIEDSRRLAAACELGGYDSAWPVQQAAEWSREGTRAAEAKLETLPKGVVQLGMFADEVAELEPELAIDWSQTTEEEIPF